MDTLVLEQDKESAEPLHLECRTFPANRRVGEIIPNDERNLVWRAVLAVRQIRELPKGLRITLWKRIPSQAGLGGGSSDAAAMLLLLDRAFDLQLKLAELWGLASNLGSDVPFFLSPTAQVARGRGEILVPIQGIPRLHCVVIAPPAGLSTPAVYGRSRVPVRPHQLEPLLTGLQAGKTKLKGLLWNSLEPAAREMSSDIERIADAVQDTGAISQLMSGSGSSYFGVYRSARVATQAAKHLAGRGLGKIFQVSTI